MYSITNGTTGRFETIVLANDETKTVVTLTPKRGGMIYSICQNGKEHLYINKENFYDEAQPPERPRCAFPVLFPSLGMCENEKFVSNAKEYNMPIHGIVQHQQWSVEQTSTDGCASVTLKAVSDEKTKISFPFDYEVRITYVLKDKKITLQQEYKNVGEGQMPFAYGFHPYFIASEFENLNWQIDAQGVANAPTAVFENMPQKIVLPYEKDAASYTIFKNPKNSAIMHDTKLDTKIKIGFDSSFEYLILWCICDKGFICIEPWAAVPNQINTNPPCILGKNESKNAEIYIEIL